MTTLYDPVTGRAVAVYRTDGTLAWGGGETNPPETPVTPVSPPNGPMLNVATRASAGANGATPAGGTGGTLVGTRHRLVVDVADATLAWTATHEYGPDGGGTFHAAYSINDGPIHPITFGGVSTWYVNVERHAPVATWTADPVSLNAHAGDVLTVYVHAVTDSTASVISDQTRQTPQDVTATGTWDTAMKNLSASSTSGAWSYRPARVVAPSDKTSWLVVGDSIMQQPWSYGERALDARGLAGVKSAMGGDAYIYYPGRWQERVGEHSTTSPYMIDQFGVNRAGEMATKGLAFWNYSKARTVKYIVKTTISPTTLQGATIGNPEAQTDNAWLRDGAPLTADKTTALPTGTTDATAVRCDVIRPDGTIKRGTGNGHPIDAVSDTAARIEASPGYLSDEAAAVIGGDKLHPSPAVHAMLADRLARDLGILGF